MARASGLGIDARVDQPFVSLGDAFRVVQRETGDVRARFEVRAEEFAVSAAVIADLAARLASSVIPAQAEISTPPRAVRAIQTTATASAGLGVVEAWRGTLVHRVEVNDDGTLARVKVVDPSFCTWPALGVALADTIVPDFPLANKSFNCSYAGNDL